MERATEQIKRNLENNPGNPGLERALDQLRINQIRQSDQSNGGGGSAVPVTRPQPVVRPERVQTPSSPARANRPERPLLRRAR